MGHHPDEATLPDGPLGSLTPAEPPAAEGPEVPLVPDGSVAPAELTLFEELARLGEEPPADDWAADGLPAPYSDEPPAEDWAAADPATETGEEPAAAQPERPEETWPELAGRLLGRTYLGVLGGLLLCAMVPIAFGWSASLVMSGSMQPHINPGDVLVVEPVSEVHPGNVVVVDDPDHPGRLRAHRVVAVGADGTLVLRGDANEQVDSTPVAPEALRGMARLRVPYIALPAVWMRTGESVYVAGWLLLTAMAVLAAGGVRPERRSRDRTGPRRFSSRSTVPGATALSLTGLLGLAAPLAMGWHGTDAAYAALSGSTSNPDSTFSADANFCAAPGTTSLTATADSWVTPGVAVNHGSGAQLELGNGESRVLVRFALPAIPARCSVTAATLSLSVSTGTAGRTVEVYRADRAWAEGTVDGVTDMPLPAGAGTTAVTAGDASTLSLDVLGQVTASYTGSDHGLLLKEQTEAGSPLQVLESREAGGAGPPTLTITFD